MANRFRASLVVVVVGAALLNVSGCGIRQRILGKAAASRNGTLTVTPSTGPPGTRFSFVAAGFKPGEGMTFEVDVPGQRPFVGPAHAAAADGTVASSYLAQKGDPPGSYQVKAAGAKGTRSHTTLIITAAPSG